MYVLQPINQAKALVTASETVGAKLPAPLLTAYQRAARIADAARRISGGDRARAVTEALDAGRDPARDPDVLAAYLAGELANAGIRQGVEGVVGGELVDVFREHADGIVAAWRTPFDKAAAGIAAGHHRIGDLPLDAAGAIMRKGGDIAAAWAQAQEAVTVVDRIDSAWVTLNNLTGFARTDPRYPALRIATATAEEWDASGLERRRASAWDVQRAGLTLALADGPEYARRIAAVQPAPALTESA